MNITAELLKLYCTNIRCKRSVYNDIKEISVSLNEKNIAATHVCHECLRPLVSSIDLGLEEMLANVAIKLSK